MSHDDTLRALHELGGQFVLCRNKVPYQKEWQSKYPSIEEALKQGPKELGILLASLSIVGVDVDVSQPQPGDKTNSRVKRSVAQTLKVREILGPPLGMVTTPSGGTHMLYKGTGREAGMKWAYGDICGAKLHAVLYEPAETLKAAEIAQSDDVEPVDVSKLKDLSHNSPGRKTTPRHTPEGLRGMVEGEGRNIYLNTGVFGDARDGELTPERTDAWREAAHESGLSPAEIDATRTVCDGSRTESGN